MAYVLIVDDDEDFANAAATALASDGHEVRTHLEADNAVEVMKAEPPDLVILDVMFPEDSSAGFALARRMRHFTEELCNVPILMLTAINVMFPLGFSKRDIDENWLPVADFLEKPVDLNVLTRKVAALLSEREASPEPTRNQHAE